MSARSHMANREESDHTVLPGVQCATEALEARPRFPGKRGQRDPERLRLQYHVREIQG